jgi:hypothetical protein
LCHSYEGYELRSVWQSSEECDRAQRDVAELRRMQQSSEGYDRAKKGVAELRRVWLREKRYGTVFKVVPEQRRCIPSLIVVAELRRMLQRKEA